MTKKKIGENEQKRDSYFKFRVSRNDLAKMRELADYQSKSNKTKKISVADYLRTMINIKYEEMRLKKGLNDFL